MVGFSGSANSNMLSEFSWEQERLPWQPNLGKNKPKLHRFQFCTTYREIFRVNNSLLGSANSNMLSEFSRNQGQLPWQPNLGKKSQNCTNFSSVQEVNTFFAWTVGFLRSANSNMLSEFSGEQGRLPWQPNLGQVKPKLHWFLFCTRYRDIFRVNSRFSGSTNQNMISESSKDERELPW